MKPENKFLYRKAMKDARIHFKEMGPALLLFMVLFGLFKTFLLVPGLGKIWGLALNSTPDGFISNSNFKAVLTQTPWVLMVGFLLIILYAFIALWQTTVLFIWISYMRSGQRILLKDLLRLSFVQFGKQFKLRNWMLLLHTLIIMPMSDLYQTNSVIRSFVVPGYIQEYIFAKPLLLVIYIVLGLLLMYIALRWFFLLPSFILKRNDFKEARRESKNITARGWFCNGINMFLYSLVEYIRFSMIPVIVIMLPVCLSYYFTRKHEFSINLFYTIGLSMSFSFIKSVTGTLAQISVLYFLVELYFTRLREQNLDTTVALPELRETERIQLNVRRLLLICSGIFAVLPVALYLGALKLSETDSKAILELVSTTDIIAHKGYSSKAPENTMPAFELAAKCDKVDSIELDVWSTKDGIPVVLHNASIKDATGVDKLVYECTYDELKDLPAPYNMSVEEFPTARIPTLEEVIQKYAENVPLLIEIKGFNQDPELSAKIVRLLQKYGVEHSSKVQSPNYKAITAVKVVDPSIECGLIIAMVTGNYYDLPNADFFSVEESFIDLDTVLLLHRRGKDIYAWTVNDYESAHELKLSGVNGLITDYPEEIEQMVEDTNGLVNGLVQRTIVDTFDSSQEVHGFMNYAGGKY